MTTIRADEIQPGDVVIYDGRVRCVTHVDRRPGWAWPIASDDTGWAIALGHHLIDLAFAAASVMAGNPLTSVTGSTIDDRRSSMIVNHRSKESS